MTDKGITGGKRMSTASSTSKNRSSLPVASTSKSAGKHFAGMIATTSPGSPEQAPLIPFIKVSDNNKLLPKYSAAIQNQNDDLVPAEDLDAIQLELEMLLSTVALRYRVLKSELESVDKSDDRRDRKMPSSPGKKKRLEEKQKLRESAGKMFGHHMKKMKNPFIPPSPAPSQHTDDSMDALQYNIHHHHQPEPAVHHHFPKNDTPNKFWLTVEPYCMPITQEDVKMLDDLLEEFKGPLMPPIPELGPHYSTQWAADDIKEEQDGKGKKLTNGDIKKNEKVMGEGVTGPLTQRLVSALMEENMLPDGNCTSNENSMDMMPQRSAVVSLLKNGISIERRLRKELIEQGILDPEDMPKSQQDDEILTEIKRVRNELSTIAEYNSNEIRKLQKMAIEEMKRMEIKRKLDQIDHEIIECHKRIRASRLKRAPLTKQERDEVYRLTEEQRRLSDQLASTRKLPAD